MWTSLLLLDPRLYPVGETWVYVNKLSSSPLLTNRGGSETEERRGDIGTPPESFHGLRFPLVYQSRTQTRVPLDRKWRVWSTEKEPVTWSVSPTVGCGRRVLVSSSSTGTRRVPVSDTPNGRSTFLLRFTFSQKSYFDFSNTRNMISLYWKTCLFFHNSTCNCTTRPIFLVMSESHT